MRRFSSGSGRKGGMLKFLASTVGLIFVVGLIVVVLILALIF